MNPIFLSDKAEQGFELLRKDLDRLREKNQEVIPEKHLRWLDKVTELSRVLITIVVSVAVIIAVYTILNATGIDAIRQLTNWAIDLLKLARLVA